MTSFCQCQRQSRNVVRAYQQYKKHTCIYMLWYELSAIYIETKLKLCIPVYGRVLRSSSTPGVSSLASKGLHLGVTALACILARIYNRWTRAFVWPCLLLHVCYSSKGAVGPAIWWQALVIRWHCHSGTHATSERERERERVQAAAGWARHNPPASAVPHRDWRPVKPSHSFSYISKKTRKTSFKTPPFVS